MASGSEQTTADFSEKSFEEKKEFVIQIILKMTNFNDPSARTLDWSTTTKPLFVNSILVRSFIRSLNFERICSQLTGKKTVEESYFWLLIYLEKWQILWEC